MLRWMEWVVVLLLVGVTFAGNSFDKKRVGTEVCLASQFCHEENAIAALTKDFRASEDEARQFYLDAGDIKSCSCNDSCVFFDTCCQDKHSKLQTVTPPRLTQLINRLREDKKAYTCESVVNLDLVVINTCPNDAPTKLKELCTKELSADDAFWELKATSKLSQLTYKNIYCGLCNKELFDELVPWVWNFDCTALNSTNPNAQPSGNLKGISKLASENGCRLNETVPSIPNPDANMEVYAKFSVYIDSLNFCNATPISTCREDTTESLMEQCRDGPNAFVTLNKKVYKNEGCLRCNVPHSEAYQALCESCEHGANGTCEHKPPETNANLLNTFGVLVQSYPHDSTTVCKPKLDSSCNGYFDMIKSCGYGYFLNHELNECERICPGDSQMSEGQCVFSMSELQCHTYRNYPKFTELERAANSSIVLDGKIFKLLTNEPTQCYNCSYVVNVTNHGYITHDQNGDLVYNGKAIPANMIFRDGNETWLCLDQAYVVEEVITGIALGISMIALVLYFCAFFMMKRLRNVPGKIVAGNMMCLFLAYVLFYLRNAVQPFSTGCITFAILIHYFLLASFIFNIIYASFIVHSLEFIDFESSVNHWTAIRMWVIGLLLPLVIVVPAFVLDYVHSSEYKPLYGGEQCFLMNEYGRYIFFIAPIGLCLLIALILYIVILIKLIQIARATSQVRSNHKEKVAIAMKLIVVLGFCWLFAVTAAASRHPILMTIFLVTCCLQGFFSFIVFICNKASLRDIRKHCRPRKGSGMYAMGEVTMSKTPTSTASTDLTKNLLKPTESTLSTVPSDTSMGKV